MMLEEFDGDNRPLATVTMSDGNFGTYRMSNDLTRLETRFLGTPEQVEKLKSSIGEALEADDAEDLGLITYAYDDIDWEDEVRLFMEERASFSPDALTGMEANLRFAGPETMETRIFGRLTAWQNWIFQRPNAVGEDGALQRYGTGVRGKYNMERVDFSKNPDLNSSKICPLQEETNARSDQRSVDAANAFNSGVKGRYMEQRIDDDHKLQNDTYAVTSIKDGKILTEDVPALTAINMRLRDDYVRDAAGGIGVFSSVAVDPDGAIISAEEWTKRKDEWLPTKADGDYIQSLMVPCFEPGKYASWIAAPKVGIDNKPGTGSAPMRAFTMQRQRSGATGGMTMFFGARTPESLPYFGPLKKIPERLLKQHLVFSRLPDQDKEYVQDRMIAEQDEIAALLQNDNTHIYICGLRGMEEGVELAMTSIAESIGEQWTRRDA
ncbi:Benzoyl-CoA-dihydrodiol lyase [Nymphon striatum]|nr:Benzoyl-CoA-dihydrodiol lyase [Nymphon striatum]